MNLSFVNETVLDKQVDNAIFDNYWYKTREELMKAKTYTGFIVSTETGGVELYRHNHLRKQKGDCQSNFDNLEIPTLQNQ